MWSIEDELAFREDLIAKVIAIANAGNGMLSRAELGRIEYAGKSVRVIDSYSGIWNPADAWPFPDQLRATLSINTTLKSKYSDKELGSGLWRYDYQSGSSDGKNRKMRIAMELQLPLLWFRQDESGQYVPYRVFVIEDFRDEQYCLVAPDLSLASAVYSESEIERRYAARLMKQRLHQPAFRARVLNAYQTKCAVCQLRHGQLLDAAHITPDSDETSSTSVTNGLSLCKIHHTAYDINIVGIDPNYVVHIREDVLHEVDGPMLEHGLKKMAGRQLWVPSKVQERPERDRLDMRFTQFLAG